MKRALYALVFIAATLIPAAAAHAQVGFTVRVGPAYYAGYAPPCPGPGYVWTDGYYSGPVWVPGRWAYRAYSGREYNGYYHRDWDRDQAYYRHDRGWDDHDNGRHNGWDRHDHEDRR